tara:strand:- start:1129 stop:2232 length:1104 start_codon:yes stop_codon:yes gene_type:complete
MRKILIADDESNILMLLEIMLRDLDAEIISAENGEEAIDKAFKEKPDLIISDVVMPKLNGFEVCKQVRKSPEIENTPIILLSALGDEYNKLTGFDEGADDYIIKPFNVEELKARAKSLLTRYSAKKNKQTQAQIVSRETDVTKTGNTILDDHLYGGLPKGSNILIVGPTGSGKSTFCRNFIQEGLDNNESSIIVSIDDDPKKIRGKLDDSLSTQTSIHETNNIFRIIDAYSWSSLMPSENEKYSISGTLELNQLAGIISDASFDIGHSVQIKKGGRRLIDSISSLFVNFDLSNVQRFLNQIARTAVAFGGVTTLFVLEEGTVDSTILNNIKYIMDGVIEFKNDDAQRSCKISSMKWAKANTKKIVLN